jgi:hypothetical protein
MIIEKSSPIRWPLGWKRSFIRKNSQFATRTIAQAYLSLTNELKRLKAENIIISTNQRYKKDGDLAIDQSGLKADPGVAVYFSLNNNQRVLACDKWNSLAENIYAIAKHIDAIRGQARWGVGTIDQGFAGYMPALPGPQKRDWTEVLNLSENANALQIENRYKELAKQRHPDAGGTSYAFSELQAAYKEAMKKFN